MMHASDSTSDLMSEWRTASRRIIMDVRSKLVQSFGTRRVERFGVWRRIKYPSKYTSTTPVMAFLFNAIVHEGREYYYCYYNVVGSL